MAQILRILIDNAIVHTPEGTGIVVSVEGEDGRARLVVRRQRARASIATRSPTSSSPSTPGTTGAGSGLGLAIARELAGRMQGHLEVRSRPGRTSFVLMLPGATVARPAPVPAA